MPAQWEVKPHPGLLGLLSSPPLQGKEDSSACHKREVCAAPGTETLPRPAVSEQDSLERCKHPVCGFGRFQPECTLKSLDEKQRQDKDGKPRSRYLPDSLLLVQYDLHFRPTCNYFLARMTRHHLLRSSLLSAEQTEGKTVDEAYCSMYNTRPDGVAISKNQKGPGN